MGRNSCSLIVKERGGLYLPSVPLRLVKERRVGEVWQGTSGTWFQKRPDGKVVRINLGSDYRPPPTVKESPVGKDPNLDETPLELAEDRGMSSDTLINLCRFELNRVNDILKSRGDEPLRLSDMRLKVMKVSDITPTKEVEQDSRLNRMAGRMNRYEGEFAQDYAPIALEADGITVMDGNHRLKAHGLTGLDQILVLVPRSKAEEVNGEG